MAGGIGCREQHGRSNLLWTGNFTERNAELELLAKAANAPLFRIIAGPQGALHVGIR